MNSLRILVLSEGLPYPTYKGADLRIWQNINGLMSVGEVGVFGLCSNDPHRFTPPPGPSFWRSSSDPELTYPPRQNQKLASRAWFFDPRGHPSDWYYSESAVTELTDLLNDFKPQIAVVESLWLHRYIDVLQQQNCQILLDSHNVETATYQGRADRTEGNDLRSRLIREVLPARTAMVERGAARATNQIWACSAQDARIMKEVHQSPAQIHVVPNGLDLRKYDPVHIARPPTPAIVDRTRKSVAFSGMFGYWPNAAAATFLIEQFFPRLTALFPDSQLLLIGNMPTVEMQQAAKADRRIIVTGMVPDTLPYLTAASVLVAPIFEGGGSRFKILEALAARIPMVSTAKGAEGLEVKDGTHLLLAETPDQFIEALRRIWTDEDLRARLQLNGYDLVRQNYSWDAAHRQIRNAVLELTSSEARPTLK